MKFSIIITLIISLSDISLALDGENKQLGLFNVVKFKNDVCVGNNQRNGTCYTTDECEERNGFVSGTCAEGYGVCCIIKLSCGATGSDNITYLVLSPTQSPGDSCFYKICPSSKAICRLRFDFIKFEIAGPYSVDMTSTNEGSVGDCNDDAFTVTSGGNTGSPMICGTNTGHHLYVDVVNTLCSIASFTYGSGSTSTRQYDIRVSQYECHDEIGGPSGCLQYYTATSGTLATFNYPIGATSLTTSGTGQTTHLSDHVYSICIRRASGYCSVCYVPSFRSTTAASFGLSTSAITTQATHDTDCSQDYIVLPQAVDTAAIASTDSPVSFGKERICGRVFTAITNGKPAAVYTTSSASVCSGVRPFRIGVRFDQNEAQGSGSTDTTQEHGVSAVPNGIIGFSLNYVQQKC